jgi:Tfp pilus assembly protein PilO
MKKSELFLVLILAAIIGVFAFDRFYVSNLHKKFTELEKRRIITSNKHATAKIVYENLNHVRELVFANMVFPGQRDSITHETELFDFITTCVNDLKLKIVLVKPGAPVTVGKVTTCTYDIGIEGNFFKFGELCAKFENSRRIISLESFEVDLLSDGRPGSKSDPNVGIRIKMKLNTYIITKGS